MKQRPTVEIIQSLMNDLGAFHPFRSEYGKIEPMPYSKYAAQFSHLSLPFLWLSDKWEHVHLHAIYACDIILSHEHNFPWRPARVRRIFILFFFFNKKLHSASCKYKINEQWWTKPKPTKQMKTNKSSDSFVFHGMRGLFFVSFRFCFSFFICSLPLMPLLFAWCRYSKGGIVCTFGGVKSVGAPHTSIANERIAFCFPNVYNLFIYSESECNFWVCQRVEKWRNTSSHCSRKAFVLTADL